jgi:hypothetical protein
MLFRDQLILVAITEPTNDLGNSVRTETQTTVFADKASVRQSEFYQASASGLRPELMFIVPTVDYAQQPYAIWNSKRYKIIRTYDRPDETTELLLQGLTNGVI